MIEAVGLSKRYEDGFLALDALSLKVEPGEIYCLLGANGAGKTTALNIFLDFISPTLGNAFVNGIDAIRNPLEVKRHVAYLSETVMLYGHFTARRNLEFFATLAGKRIDRSQCLCVLREVGLPEKAFDQKVCKLSKGMRQKLGLAICILKDAPALILDEPMTGLDPRGAVEFTEILKELRGQGKAVLMTTHDIFRAKELADRVGILKEGRKVLERTREELQYENLEQLYIGYIRGGEGPAALEAVG